mgnify:CR=1
MHPWIREIDIFGSNNDSIGMALDYSGPPEAILGVLASEGRGGCTASGMLEKHPANVCAGNAHAG